MKYQIQHLLTVFMLVTLAHFSKAQTADFTMSTNAACSGATVNFTNQSTGATSYMWYVDGVSIGTFTDASYQVYNDNTYVISLVAIDGSGNRDTSWKTLRSRAMPNYQFSFDQSPSFLCLGTELTVSQWSIFEGVDSIHWDFGDGTTSNLKYPRHTFSRTGTFQVTASVYGQCGMNSKSVSVNVVDGAQAKPMLSLNAASAICPGQSVSIYSSDYSGGEPDSIRTYTGDGNSTLKRDFQYSYPNTGIYEIKAVGYNACGTDTATRSIDVNNNFTPSQNMYVYPREVCPGQDVSVNVGLSEGSYALVDFGDGATDTFRSDHSSVNHIYNSPGKYIVEATVYPECGNSVTIKDSLEVKAGIMPSTYRLYLPSKEFCPGEEFSINSPYLQSGDTFEIDMGDGTYMKYFDTTGLRIPHTYTMAGTYTLTTKKTNICGVSVGTTDIINVTANSFITPYIHAQMGANAQVCVNDTAFYSITSGYGREYHSVAWSFSDGLSGNGRTFNRQYQNKGTYEVIATLKDQCGHEYRVAHTERVFNSMMRPKAHFWLQPKVACAGEQILLDQVSSFGQQYYWDYGDGNSKKGNRDAFHEFYSYSAPGYYMVEHRVVNGCGSDTDSHPVVVEAGPAVSILVDSTTVMQGTDLSFTANVSNASSYEWEFPDGSMSTEMNPSYTFNSIGKKQVFLRAWSPFDCMTEEVVEIQVGGLGIHRIADQNSVLRVYPVPAHSNLRIDILDQGLKSNVTIQLVDIQGRVVSSDYRLSVEEIVDIDLQELALKPGMYWLRVIGSDRSVTRQIAVH